jgi:hypothetical protein
MISDGTASFKSTSALRRGPIRWLILGGMLLIAAIAIGATVMAGNFRERALRNSERELENTCSPAISTSSSRIFRWCKRM